MGRIRYGQYSGYQPLIQELKKKYDVPKRIKPENVKFYLFRRGALDVLGGKCSRCGFSDWRALEIDHKNGDGKFERTILGLQTKTIHRALCFNEINIEKYQILCSNCHSIKTYEQYDDNKELYRMLEELVGK